MRLHVRWWLFLVVLLAVLGLAGLGVGDGADSDGAKGGNESLALGDYVWGPRIARCDLDGRVLVCVGFNGDERSASHIPNNMVLDKFRHPRLNLALLMVLTNDQKLARAMRILSAGKVKIPVVCGAKIPNLKMQTQKGGGGGKKGRRRGRLATILVEKPDGTVSYCGLAEPGKAAKILEDIGNGLSEFPSCITNGQRFTKHASTLRQLAATGKYSSALKKLKTKTKSKDATEAGEAETLILNIEDYGKKLLAKAKYFAGVHLPTAEMTYTRITKDFSGTELAKEASDRLKALKADKNYRTEVAACRLADQIRSQCALLGPVGREDSVDLSDPNCRKRNKKIVPRLLRDVAIFKKRYLKTTIAEECSKLLSAYGVELEE